MSAKIELRENVIGYIYSYELIKKELDSVEAFESGKYTDKEIKTIEYISKNYQVYKKLILKFTSNSWTWIRTSPLIRAILIYGAFELYIEDTALVIDVLVNYTKDFIPDDTYKLVHSVLDKIGKQYEAIKTSKK